MAKKVILNVLYQVFSPEGESLCSFFFSNICLFEGRSYLRLTLNRSFMEWKLAGKSYLLSSKTNWWQRGGGAGSERGSHFGADKQMIVYSVSNKY